MHTCRLSESITIFTPMTYQTNVITFKASKDFADHLQAHADKKKLKRGAFIKAVLKKHTGFKEKPLI